MIAVLRNLGKLPQSALHSPNLLLQLRGFQNCFRISSVSLRERICFTPDEQRAIFAYETLGFIMDFKFEDYANDSSSIRERILKKEAITSKIIKKT
jgi:hypothetical protein